MASAKTPPARRFLPIRRLSGVRSWRRMLDRLTWFWLRAGISPQELLDCFGRCLTRHRKVTPLTIPPPEDLEFQRVLTFWRTEPAYLDDAGRPKILPVEGDSMSFTHLVALALPDAPADRVLAHLLHGGLIEVASVDHVKLKHLVNVPTGTNQGEILAHTISGLAAMIETCFRNVRKPDELHLYQRTVIGERFDLSKLPEFEAFLRPLAQELALKVDGWLREHEIDPDTDPTVRTGHVGVGIFGFHDGHPKTGDR